MKKSRFVREMTGWKRHNHNAFLSSSALVNEDWNVNGDWNFAGNVSSDNPISAADPVDADDLVTLGYFETHAGLYQGVLDASAGIPYPAASEGMYWRISVAGVIGTTQVEVGDQVIAIADYAGGMDDTKFMIVQTNTQVTSVTYGQLQSLITNGALEIGRHYLITDYVTAYNIFDGGTNTVIENQVGIVEPLEVVAIGVDALAKEAYSFAYPDDIIYYNAYAKPVDRAAFIAAGDVGFVTGGSLVAEFKGVIEFRHDTKQNVSTWYDFRNIKFRRWAVDAVDYNGATAYVAKDVCKSGVDGKIYKCLTATTGEGDPTVNTADWILWLDIVSDAYVSWTSDKTKFNIGNINTGNLIFIPATYQDVYTFGSWYNHVNDVTIGHNNLTLLIAYGYNTTLNNIVFKTTDNLYTCYSNEIGEVSYNNTIGNAFSSNTIGNDFFSNTIGNSFSYNTIGNAFFSNTIGNDFFSNTIENGFSYNIIGNGFSSNIIENDFGSNIIGNSFRYNTIGNKSKVSGGLGCEGNSIGDFNDQVTLGNGCYGISIGEKNITITLGATNTDISIGNGNTAVTIGDDCTGCTIGNGNDLIVFGASNSSIFVGNGNAITTGDSCLSIDIGESNTITLGTGCVKLTFLNGCVFNTNTAPNGLQNNIFESGTNITATDFTTATHIKAAYNTTVFMNATPAVKISYFDALNALTVDDVNA
jgi:hypothetical protein